MLSDSELAAIRARCEAATAGPWGAAASSDSLWWVGPDPERLSLVASTSQGNDEANARFIAAARADVPALLDDAAEARRIIGTMRRALRYIDEDARLRIRRQFPNATLDRIGRLARAALGGEV